MIKCKTPATNSPEIIAIFVRAYPAAAAGGPRNPNGAEKMHAAPERKQRYDNAPIRSPSRTFPIFDPRRTGQYPASGGQGHGRRTARHRHHGPRRHVRHQGVLQLCQEGQGQAQGQGRRLREKTRGAARRRSRGGGDRRLREAARRAEAQARFQTHHRLRGLRGAPQTAQQGGQARPERLPPHPAGQEPEGLPQPHQDRLEGVDRGLLHAPAYGPRGDREVPRGTDLLLGLSGGRSPARDHGRRHGEGRGVDPLAQAGLRRRLLSGAPAPQGDRRAGQPRGLPHAAQGEQTPARTGRQTRRTTA